MHDIARVVAVEVIAPRDDIDRDPRASRGVFDGVLDFLFQIDVGAGDMPAARGTTSVVVPALASPWGHRLGVQLRSSVCRSMTRFSLSGKVGFGTCELITASNAS